MLEVEKLKIPDNVANHIDYYNTFTDTYLNRSQIDDYLSYEDLDCDTSPLKNTITNTLTSNNIALGKNYGIDGIEIQSLLEKNTDYVIEIPVHHIQYYNIEDIQRLSNKNKIMLLDLEELDTRYIKWGNDNLDNIVGFISKAKLNTDNVYYFSTHLEKIDLKQYCRTYKVFLDKLNHIIVPAWYIMITSCSDKQFVNGLDNQVSYLQQYKQNNFENFACFPNMKPNLWRVLLLSMLEKEKILQNIDWGLVSKAFPFNVNQNDTPYFINTYELFAKDLERHNLHNWLTDNPYYANIIKEFFSKYGKELPKCTFTNETVDVMSPFSHSPEQVKTYKYRIEVERNNVISEKFAKCILSGAMPIYIHIHKSNYIPLLQSMGYKVPELNLNTLEGTLERIKAVFSYIQTAQHTQNLPNDSDILHNIELTCNKDFLSNIFTQPLIDTFTN